MMKKALVLVSMALVVAVLVAGIAGVGSDSPAVYASRVAGISAAGKTGIQVQNLDQSDPAAVSADFYHSGGNLEANINVGSVPAGAAANIYLPSQSELPTGAYAAIINADRQIAAIARTDWETSHGAAIYSNVIPGQNVSLALVERKYYGGSSLVSIQNTDQQAAASATVKIYKSGDTNPAVTQTYSIPQGTSITLDLEQDVEFAGLGDQFLGSMTVESATEIGVMSFVDIATSEKAVYAFEGVPSEMASDTLYAPLFRAKQYVVAGNPASGRLDTGISIVNPGDSAVDVTLTYYGADNPSASAACRGKTFTSPTVTIQSKSSHVFYQGNPAAENLPDDCFGSAVAHATGGGILGIVNDSQNEGETAAAFNAVTAEQGATTVALPLYRRNHVGLSTGISVMNVGTEDANVTAAFTPAGASPVSCSNCSGTVSPGGTLIFWPPALNGLTDGTYGSASITSSQPVAVIVNDFSMNGTTDAATYNGIKADVQ